MDVQQAIDAPRFRHWSGNRVSFEAQIPQPVIDELKSMGHTPQNPLIEMSQIMLFGPTNRGLIFGGGQAIIRSTRGYIAGTDSRRDGLAAAH